ncbi:DEKNAAC104388 [Brettanomyces naardenensis]|uniref:DEKNAAC104388 n=1 Tax=Brettanomyces naardenensis TaxID=13370 RepID=A0A448YQY6_BRENA|nr:DEKNAAC104388 [Brettanomyces naardenensis]
MSQQDVITQVSNDLGSSQPILGATDEMEDYNTEIQMSLRGQMFTITRDDLMALPESVLLCLFPNGVFVDKDGNVITNLTEDDVVYVNFSPDCFQYICSVFDSAVRDLQIQEQQQQSPKQQVYDINDPSILSDKPSIIVLREDLDYYCIPPVTGLTADQMRQVKILVGHKLVSNNLIFDGLGYKPGKQLKPAEQHLMDMLCSSGFSVGGDWGHRSLEPGKTVIFSLTLVRLSNNTTANSTPAGSPNLMPVSSASSTVSTERKRTSRLSTFARAVSRASSRTRKEKTNSNATKLLLFWRKPARKCWWSDVIEEVDLSSIGIKGPNGDILGLTNLKVHIRRVWTLELSIIGVQ